MCGRYNQGPKDRYHSTTNKICYNLSKYIYPNIEHGILKNNKKKKGFEKREDVVKDCSPGIPNPTKPVQKGRRESERGHMIAYPPEQKIEWNSHDNNARETWQL